MGIFAYSISYQCVVPFCYYDFLFLFAFFTFHYQGFKGNFRHFRRHLGLEWKYTDLINMVYWYAQLNNS